MANRKPSLTPRSLNVNNRPQRLLEVEFIKLKNLHNLKISFKGKNITGIFGTNGSGKSTVLHALACIYQPNPNSKQENLKFPKFFPPTTLDIWNDSRFIVEYAIIDGRDRSKLDSKVYHKAIDRWKPRYEKRIPREVYYIGVDSSVPAMELETRKTKISLIRQSYTDTELALQVKKDLSYIMNREYTEFNNFWNEKKDYSGLNYNGISYPSLYMGAGEQRLIKILNVLYASPEHSLILIDEIELTLHTEALLRLIEVMDRVCSERFLQVVFTSHKEELLDCPLINIRYIISKDNRSTVCLDRTTPDCIRNLTGHMPKPLTIYVEDLLASALVRRILEMKGMEKYCKVVCFGSKENAYQIGAGFVVEDNDIESKLIVLDGDVECKETDKQKKIRSVLTGSDDQSHINRRKLRDMIREFKLPADTAPEKFIHDVLVRVDDSRNTLIPHIKGVGVCSNTHDYLNIPIEDSGKTETDAYKDIAEMMSEQPEWTTYVQEIDSWIENQKPRLNLN